MRPAYRSPTSQPTALMNAPQPAALRQPKGRAAPVPRSLPIPCFISTKRRKIERKIGQITGNLVFARTSAPDGPPQAPMFAAASHQNAPASLPLTGTGRPAVPYRISPNTSHRFPVQPMNRDPGGRSLPGVGARIAAFLIYGTGIKKLWKPTPIDEYKLLIYGKPRLSILPVPAQTHLGRKQRAVASHGPHRRRPLHDGKANQSLTSSRPRGIAGRDRVISGRAYFETSLFPSSARMVRIDSLAASSLLDGLGLLLAPESGVAW